MKRLIGFIFSIPMWIVYPFVLLLLIFGPIICANEALTMIKTGAPADVLPLAFIGFIGFYLFVSIRWQRMRFIYRKFPVLLPALQMAFIMLIVFDVADTLLQGWADHNAFPKGLAVAVSLILFVIGRIYLSYWYTKHPISAKMRRM